MLAADGTERIICHEESPETPHVRHFRKRSFTFYTYMSCRTNKAASKMNPYANKYGVLTNSKNAAPKP
jgi:hypothetical protein